MDLCGENLFVGFSDIASHLVKRRRGKRKKRLLLKHVVMALLTCLIHWLGVGPRNSDLGSISDRDIHEVCYS